MDEKLKNRSPDPIVVTGVGQCLLPEKEDKRSLDISPWLKSRKMKKFMGKQDMLSVIACGKAIQDAHVPSERLEHQTGLFLAVGYIPFEKDYIEEIASASTLEGKFSMERFSEQAVKQTDPLLTFRCLPNMPIFHDSLNFGIQGPYFVTYPGVGQFYTALEQAVCHLEEGKISLALAGGVADQENFLVRHHYKRLGDQYEMSCVDAAGFLCLERLESAQKRGASIKGILNSYRIDYHGSPLKKIPKHEENIRFNDQNIGEEKKSFYGPSSLIFYLNQLIQQNKPGEMEHVAKTLDHFAVSSKWLLL